MIVRVYNFLSEEKPKFSQNLVGIVSDVTSFKYTRRAYDIGSFEMVIPTHADETDCIQPDRMLIVGDKIQQTYIESDHTKRIVIGTFLYVTDVEKKDDTITVTGYDLKYLFALRVTLFPKEEQDKGTYGYYVTSGTTFSCISDIINYNIVNATDSDRKIYGMFGITMPVDQINAEPPLTGIQDDRYMTRLEPVSTAIFNLLKNCKTHFYDMRLIIDDNAEDGDNYNPHMESSEDKPTIIIDESRYNIKSYARKDGTSAYKNAIYAVVGSGDAVTVKCVKRPDDTASGVKRKEVVLDVDTDSVSEIDRYALKAAEEYVISDDFEIEPLFMDDEAEPELAQKVSIRIDGIEYNTVITEITDEYANGKHSQSYVCGDKKLKVLNVLNKATAGNTQKIVNNKIAAGTKEGVGRACGEYGTSEIFNDYENNTAPSAQYAHAEGYKSTASGNYSHAGGKDCTASGGHSFAHGNRCVASGSGSVALGGENKAGDGSFAFGTESLADNSSVVFGEYSSAINHSFAFGHHLISDSSCFTVGAYNIENSYAIFAVGYGSERKRATPLWLGRDGVLHVEGGITTGGGFDFSNSIASADTLGVVKVGSHLSITEDGKLSVSDMPGIASASKAGIIKVGNDLEISEDGTLSVVKGGTLPPATQTTLGGVIVGHGFSVDDNGFLSLLLSDSLTINNWGQLDIYGASSQTAGIVKIGSGITEEYQRNEDTGMLITKISVQPATTQKAGIVKVGEGLSVEADGTLNADIYPPASLFLSGASKMMLHKYIPVESKKQGYYYGSVTSDIICDTVKYYSYPPDFPESYIVIPNWYSSTSASAVVTSNAAFKLTKPTIDNNGSTFTIKVVCEALNYSSGLYKASDFYNTTIYFVWKNIKEPTDKFPNGYITCELHLYYCDTSGMTQDRSLKTGYIPFASKAEYNAAICLTATELPTFDLSEEKYTLLVPNSLCLLSGELPSTKLAEEGVIYLTPNENNTTFKQYMWNGTEYKYLGETEHKVDAKEIGAATAADITAAINAVSIGGRNIATGSADMIIGAINHATWKNGQWRKSGTGDSETIDIADPPIPSISKGVRFTQTTGKKQIGIVQDKVLINSNTVYTLSCWARSNSADGVTCRLQPFFKTTADNGGYSNIIVKDSWQKISFTAIRPPQTTAEYSCAYIYLQPTEIGSYIDVCAIKFEAGNKPTDWSPAPEDAERRIASLEARVAALEAAALAGGE